MGEPSSGRMRPALLHYLTAVQRGDSSYDSHLTEEMESGEQSREVTHPCPRATKWLCLGGEAGFSDRLSLPHHLVSLTSGLLGHQLFQQVSSPLFEWVQSCLHLASHPPPPMLFTRGCWCGIPPAGRSPVSGLQELCYVWVHVYLEVSSCNCGVKVQIWGYKFKPSAELVQRGTVQKSQYRLSGEHAPLSLL